MSTRIQSWCSCGDTFDVTTDTVTALAVSDAWLAKHKGDGHTVTAEKPRRRAKTS
jgi:hypothetical protein